MIVQYAIALYFQSAICFCFRITCLVCYSINLRLMISYRILETSDIRSILPYLRLQVTNILRILGHAIKRCICLFCHICNLRLMICYRSLEISDIRSIFPYLRL